jgi:hypothetical protein
VPPGVGNRQQQPPGQRTGTADDDRLNARAGGAYPDDDGISPIVFLFLLFLPVAVVAVMAGRRL